MDNIPTKEEIRTFLKTHRKDWPRQKVAENIGTSKSTLDNCLAKEPMSDSMRYEIAKLVGMLPEVPPVSEIIPDNVINVKVPHDSWVKWEEAALYKGQTVSDWLEAAGNEHSENILREKLGITMMPQPAKKKAHTMGAAGNGIDAEILDWDGSSPEINVRSYGLSMIPTIDDDEVITMTHKSASRSPYMKKGLIYLVRLEGNQMIKEYDTRKAREDEAGAEYLTNYGTVGVLKSHNPDFPDIDITTLDFEWIAWYDWK